MHGREFNLSPISRIGRRWQEVRDAAAEAMRAIIRDRLRRRLSAPKWVGCRYRLVAFSPSVPCTDLMPHLGCPEISWWDSFGRGSLATFCVHLLRDGQNLFLAEELTSNYLCDISRLTFGLSRRIGNAAGSSPAVRKLDDKTVDGLAA